MKIRMLLMPLVMAAALTILGYEIYDTKNQVKATQENVSKNSEELKSARKDAEDFKTQSESAAAERDKQVQQKFNELIGELKRYKDGNDLNIAEIKKTFEKIFHTNPAEVAENAGYLVHLELSGTQTSKEEDGTVTNSQVNATLSGLLINYAGEYYIITAGHLHEDGLEIDHLYAFFKNRQHSEEMELLSYDDVFDVALLKFKDKQFVFHGKPAVLGSSSGLRPGDQVVSLGSPLRFRFCVSSGFILDLNIGVNTGVRQPQLIMHWALINPGNSGGPLIILNEKEEVVGINVMVIRKSENPFVTNMYLAVPSDDIIRLLPKLVKGGQLKHATMNLTFENSWEINPLDYQKLGITEPNTPCVIVTSIPPGSPAEKAGLKVGDVVMECCGKKPNVYNDAVRAIYHEEPGTNGSLTIKRGDEVIKMEVPLSLLDFKAEAK